VPPVPAPAVAIADRLVDDVTILRFSAQPYRQPRDVHSAPLDTEELPHRPAPARDDRPPAPPRGALAPAGILPLSARSSRSLSPLDSHTFLQPISPEVDDWLPHRP
jgi:hypothetical protein